MTGPVVFLGPTLSADRARELLPGCEVWPPAGQGDVLRALRAGARAAGIVDGYFDQVPSVWHKEILFALEEGVPVYGASSMGALRAAELAPFGMIGVGRIFEMYRDGILEDDDEVAVTHGPAETGYLALSEAMVNVRDRVAVALAEGIVDRDAAERFTRLAKSLQYRERSYRGVAALAREDPALRPVVDRLLAFLSAPHASLKERDAVAMLERMRAGPDRSAGARPTVERTVFLERLRLQVARESRAGDPGPGGSAVKQPVQPIDRDESRAALLGLLAEEHAELLRSPASDVEIDLTLRDFLVARGLATPGAMEEWLSRNGVAPEAFMAHIREAATVNKLQHLYRAEIETRLRGRGGPVAV